MKAKNLTRNISQYQDLYNIKDKDEFLHAIVYELLIRDAKDDIIEKMKIFNIVGKQVSNIDYNKVKEQLDMEYLKDHLNKGNDVYVILDEISNEINFNWNIDILAGYWEYHFIPSETKQKLEYMKSLKKNPNIIEKQIYGESKSRSYFEDDFIRTEVDIIMDREHKTTEYTYQTNYKRPLIHPSVDGDDKRIKINVNINLPHDVLELQLKKLISLIKKDHHNILSSKNIFLKSINKDYEKTFNNPFKQKGELVNMLFAYDYEQLRRDEVEEENNINEANKKEELLRLKNNTFIDKYERKIRKDNINSKYKKIFLNSIHQEISYTLNIAKNTAKKHIEQIKKLLINKDYLQLINGTPTSKK